MKPRVGRSFSRWARLLAVAAIVVSCASTTVIEPVADSVDPTERAVSLTTTACGHASATSGAGIVVGDGLVLVAAHVVIGAHDIELARVVAPGAVVEASVIALDARTDLALLAAPGLRTEAIRLADGAPGDELLVAGGGPSGSFVTTIEGRVEVRIEEVRSTTRSSRFGYQLTKRVLLGDSGAGAFDQYGRLVAVIYGRSQDVSGMSFAVRSDEIAPILAVSADAGQTWVCDPTQHRIIPAT